MNDNLMHQQYHRGNNPMGEDIQSLCQRYMNYHVIAEMNDGSQFDGIIEGVDNDGVTMLVAEAFDPEQIRQDNENNEVRQYGYGGYGYPNQRRYRRFHRRRFPFNIFRFFFPFPYYPWF